MHQFFVSIVATFIIFYILQNIDDTRNKKINKPVASRNSRIGLYFIIFMIVQIGFYWFKNTSLINGGGGNHIKVEETSNDIENSMIMSIKDREDIMVGHPNF